MTADTDHARIWLEPMSPDGRYGCEGRLWCQDKVWPDHEGQPEPTEYVRADLFAALAEERDRLTRQLRALAVALHAKHYADVPQWQPLEDAEGILSQIDNMTTGLARALTGDTP